MGSSNEKTVYLCHFYLLPGTGTIADIRYVDMEIGTKDIFILRLSVDMGY